MEIQFCKMTDQNGYTRKGKNNECLWGENITHTATGTGSQLCTDDFIHVYKHPFIAVFMNPIHSEFVNPLLWDCEVEGPYADDGQLKSGYRTVKTVRTIPLPVITLEQRIRISIYCALKQYDEPSFMKWANGWLDGLDRSAARAAEFDLLAVIKSVVFVRESSI